MCLAPLYHISKDEHEQIRLVGVMLFDIFHSVDVSGRCSSCRSAPYRNRVCAELRNDLNSGCANDTRYVE